MKKYNTFKLLIVALTLFFSNAFCLAQLTYPIGTTIIENIPENGNSYETDTLGFVGTISDIGTYGGCLDTNVGATGFFHVKEIDSVWYVVDPEGYLFIATGVTSVVQGGAHNHPEDLKEWGINLMGNWSDESIENIPYCPRYSFMNQFKNSSTYRKDLYDEDIFPVFDVGFAEWVDGKAEDFVADYIDDPWVFGYHTDNELRLHYTDINAYLALDVSDAHYIAAYNWMMDKHGYVSPVTSTDEDDFRAYVAETYMSTVNNALKKYDPNHMNIGCRIHASVKYDEKIIKALGANLDIMSINYYNRWDASPYMDLWIEEGGVPFLITEFYTKAEDSGLDNSDGAGWLVSTKEDRIHHYENFVLTLLSHPGNIGWTWFKYIDKNEANKGIVDINYNKYEELIAAMQNVGKDVYGLRDFLINGIEETVSDTNISDTTNNNEQSTNLLLQTADQELPLVYPVPAQNSITIELSEQSNFSFCEIYNLNGRLIRRISLENEITTVDVSALRTGLYAIRYLGDSGSALTKLLIE